VRFKGTFEFCSRPISNIMEVDMEVHLIRNYDRLTWYGHAVGCTPVCCPNEDQCTSALEVHVYTTMRYINRLFTLHYIALDYSAIAPMFVKTENSLWQNTRRVNEKSSSVFVFSFSLIFVSVPCAGLSWPFRQILSVRKYIVSYRIDYRDRECVSAYHATGDEVTAINQTFYRA